MRGEKGNPNVKAQELSISGMKESYNIHERSKNVRKCILKVYFIKYNTVWYS